MHFKFPRRAKVLKKPANTRFFMLFRNLPQRCVINNDRAAMRQTTLEQRSAALPIPHGIAMKVNNDEIESL